jgi:SHS2 domain-containing protein
MSAAGWRHEASDADVEVHGWGDTRADAFAQTTLGVFALLVEAGTVASSERREVRAQADSTSALLAAWIDECLYVHEIEGFVAATVEMTVCTDRLAHGVLDGETLDPDRHTIRAPGGRPRRVSLDVDGGLHRATVVFPGRIRDVS